jgi:hypothetical protein
MYYFSTIKSRHNKTIIYNFYQSYHGHNSCDAAASHAKKRISTQQRDNPNKQIHTSTDLVNAIKTLNNHSAQNIPKITKTQMNVSTMKGIKSYFKFTFPRERKEVRKSFANTNYCLLVLQIEFHQFKNSKCSCHRPHSSKLDTKI